MDKNVRKKQQSDLAAFISQKNRKRRDGNKEKGGVAEACTVEDLFEIKMLSAPKDVWKDGKKL